MDGPSSQQRSRLATQTFHCSILGRDNFVCYSPAVSSRTMAATRGTDYQIAHKLIRLARTHFYRRIQYERPYIDGQTSTLQYYSCIARRKSN